MKRTAILLGAALVVSGCATEKVKMDQAVSGHETEYVASKLTGPKRRVAIVDFVNKTAYGQGRLGGAAADILLTEIAKTGKFIVVERDKVNKLMDEQKFGQTGAVDQATAAQMGKILGVNAIVTGAISNFGVNTTGTDFLLAASKKQVAKVTIDVRVVDTETGQVLYADSGNGEGTSTKREVIGLGGRGGYDETLEGDALRAAISQLALNIESQINQRPWSCRVADYDGSTIYINAGKMSGVEVGQKLVVFKLGREIKDPTTGLVIGRTEQRLGEAKVTDYFGDDGATAELTSGQAPAAGDMAKLPR
jgi:curli biogenesis system outer membrane secretion channel CsgG